MKLICRIFVNDRVFWKCTNTILSLITKCPDKYSASQHLFVCFILSQTKKKIIDENKQNDGAYGAIAL